MLGRIPLLTTCFAVAALAVPVAASARPVLWGGTGFNDLGPASAILSVQNGRATVSNVQMVLACTDAEDGSESDRAFSARFRTARSLSRNRYSFHFSALSGGRLGDVRLDGTLGPSTRGTIRVRINATATGDHGEVVERCQGETRFTLRRGG